jgi:hypothetical protein
MPRDFDIQPPAAYLRIRETRASPAGGPAVSVPLGEVVRVLAASRPGGVFLCLGHGAGETAAWILDGMDLASRLVVVVEDGDEAEHVQDSLAFLDDVRDHRFDLITDLNPARCARLVRLGLARLALGAFFMTRHPAPALAEMLSAPASDGERAVLEPGAFVLAHLPAELAVTLMARRPPRPPAKRRGGRRARGSVTPLFSSRARGAGN